MQHFSLLKDRRFGPYFIAQALGAFNDNLYKNIILLAIAFYLPQSTEAASLYINLAAALFILPFFLFSAHAGRLADQQDKVHMLKRLKLFELVLMLIASMAILGLQIEFMLVLLFLMGTQSAYFGPLKYAIISEQVGCKQVVIATGLVELATFSMIIAGTLLAGLIMSMQFALTVAAFGCIGFALIGYISALALKANQSVTPVKNKKSSGSEEGRSNSQTNFFATVKLMWLKAECRAVIFLISWFWFLGASLLTQIPLYVEQYVSDKPFWVSVILAVFILGLALGSILYNIWSKGALKLNKLPLCAFILSICCFNFYLLSQHGHSLRLVTSADLMQSLSGQLILANFAVLGLFGGFFVVPLYALLQLSAAQAERASMVAANNIFNALFMVVSAALAILLLTVFNLSLLVYFAILAGLNLLFSYYWLQQLKQVKNL
ncbi:MFS transporter [Gayadomonas joobiniege]|uniref:MFS transporter n=1 Tax=Gayadomonas joobiniege TaxID=1234606 RepID=UPI0003798926|nr:MFS transporter [Gayadomonas joobiniege]